MYSVIFNHDSMGEGTSLSAQKQVTLVSILLSGAMQPLTNESSSEIKDATPKGKKMGVWVSGKLKLQTRDRDAIDQYAAKQMAKRHDVWVAPIGSFVEV